MEPPPLGIPDSEGFADGCDVGHCVGWPDGADDGRTDMLGDILGCDVGRCEDEGLLDACMLGDELVDGWRDGTNDGRPDILGDSLGLDVSLGTPEG